LSLDAARALRRCDLEPAFGGGAGRDSHQSRGDAGEKQSIHATAPLCRERSYFRNVRPEGNLAISTCALLES
jgi:hypothetical protein